MIELNEKNFAETIKASVSVLVDFWAPWCAPCNFMAPIIEEIDKKYENKLKVCKFNVDEGITVPDKLGIKAIPTIIIFKEGKEVERIIGALPMKEIEEKIKKYI